MKCEKIEWSCTLNRNKPKKSKSLNIFTEVFETDSEKQQNSQDKSPILCPSSRPSLKALLLEMVPLDGKAGKHFNSFSKIKMEINISRRSITYTPSLLSSPTLDMKNRARTGERQVRSLGPRQSTCDYLPCFSPWGDRSTVCLWKPQFTFTVQENLFPVSLWH